MTRHHHRSRRPDLDERVKVHADPDDVFRQFLKPVQETSESTTSHTDGEDAPESQPA